MAKPACGMTPTPDQIVNVLPHIRYEIESFLQTPAHDESNPALRESVMLRRMAHCRALYYFFTTPFKSRKLDDVLAEDIIFSGRKFDTKELYADIKLLERFNKDLFHLTYDRLERTPATKPWPTDDLFPPVEQRSKEFIEHILKSPAGLISEAERKHWDDLKAAVSTGITLQQNTSNIA